MVAATAEIRGRAGSRIRTYRHSILTSNLYFVPRPQPLATPHSALNRLPVPAHKTFHRIILGQAELVVHGGGATVAVFGPLPEFARVAAGEHGAVFLRFVAEDRGPLEQQVAGAQRHRDFDFVQFLFLPRPAIEQHLGARTGLGLDLVQGAKDRLGAHAVRAMRIGQVASHVELRGLHALDKLANDPHVFVGDRFLGDGAGAIERQVEEVQVFFLAARHDRAGLGFAPANQSLDRQHVLAVGLARFFVSQGLRHAVLRAPATSCSVDAEHAVEFGDHVGDAAGVVIEDGDVAAGHVGDVDFVAIFDQANQRAAHADHVVVGMRAEADHAAMVLARRVVFDRVHHPAKHAVGHLWRGAVMPQQLMQAMLAKIVVVEF